MYKCKNGHTFEQVKSIRVWREIPDTDAIPGRPLYVQRTVLVWPFCNTPEWGEVEPWEVRREKEISRLVSKIREELSRKSTITVSGYEEDEEYTLEDAIKFYRLIGNPLMAEALERVMKNEQQ